ncbi:MAG: hypothetical protein NZO58_03280, partial [Gemmataceae bacterium]|nr:hypothetical protein [Gemmataceae bacterium]
FWGDTHRPSYPLGNFHVPGATSALPGRGGLDPDVGIDLEYFVDAKGFARETARIATKGATWLTTAVVLPDREGRRRLYGSYLTVQPPMKIYGRGLAVFDDQLKKFDPVVEVDLKAPHFPSGPALVHQDEEGAYVYFAHPLPTTRVRATAEAFLRPDEYESFTCLNDGTTLSERNLDRDAAGALRYAWRKGTPALSQADEAKLIAAGAIRPEEARWQLFDQRTKKPVRAHSGSVAWNNYRKRWISIFVEVGGSSYLGEVWYAEAPTLTGPWGPAVKVVTHDRYSFYNPRHHPMFDKDDGRFIYFEGTYSHTFSGNADATPRYDYNQILYKLDLADPRLRP